MNVELSSKPKTQNSKLAEVFPPELIRQFDEFVARYPVRRAALLPVMNLVQRTYGCVSREHQEAIAAYIGISPAHVYEAMTFYTLFTEKPRGKHDIHLCINVSCYLKGCDGLKEHLIRTLGISPGETTQDGLFSISTVQCLGSCGTAPVMRINDRYFEGLTVEKVDRILEKLKEGDQRELKIIENEGKMDVTQPKNGTPLIVTQHLGACADASLKKYQERGGYQSLSKVFKMKPEDIVEEVKKSAIRGRGGAGFPAGVKWGFLPKDMDKPRYMCVNADEGEPGTFKDRYILEQDPHLMLEGIVIACYACRVHTAYIYIRGEYVEPARILEKAIAEAYDAGCLGKNILGSGFDLDVYVHAGAGAYICGEETGLIESLEGKRGMPRLKPPFPAIVGLFGCPTVVNNVETLSFLPSIIQNGADWFAGIGTPKNTGTRMFTVSGDVEEPGVYELPLGIPLREMIEKYCGGMRNGKKLKMVIPGGLSSAPLAASEADIAMDFDTLMKAQSMAGSGGVIVMDETRCAVEVLHRALYFFSEESCGQCTPCREGSLWYEKVLHRMMNGGGSETELDFMINLTKNIGGKTICAMGDAICMPVRGFITKFRDDFLGHIKEKRCPFNQF